jgi:hypothetical protein
MNEKFETSNETSKLANEQLCFRCKSREAKGEFLVAAGIAHNVKNNNR